MKINAARLIRLRTERSWSQDELALASGLNLRTIQRIEKDGAASLQSRKALAAALAIDPHHLEETRTMHCPVCSSTEIYRYKAGYSLSTEDLLPGLGTIFLSAKIRPALCAACGHILFFGSEEARRKVRGSAHWALVAE